MDPGRCSLEREEKMVTTWMTVLQKASRNSTPLGTLQGKCAASAMFSSLLCNARIGLVIPYFGMWPFLMSDFFKNVPVYPRPVGQSLVFLVTL